MLVKIRNKTAVLAALKYCLVAFNSMLFSIKENLAICSLDVPAPCMDVSSENSLKHDIPVHMDNRHSIEACPSNVQKGRNVHRPTKHPVTSNNHLAAFNQQN